MAKQTESDVQRKMLQFQALEGNLKVVREQLEEVLVRLEEMSRTKKGIEDLETVKPNDSAFVPVGAGSFVKAKITDVSEVLVSIGGDMAVKKVRGDAIVLIEERIVEMKKLAEELAAQERATVTELQRLQPEIQRMLQG
jgi:prefoldin alpha subunit